ncbi:MAG: alpha-1,2-fucosyltransferase [Lachnospiraceae bacterium]|nr:alpha-1,2-fucosyltransferase [Lachnospiraceae bacterium]
MLMLQMGGGLGNQMFQYALYRALQEKGKEVCIDDTTMFEKIGRHDNRLEDIFPLTYCRASKSEYNRLTDSSLAPWDRVRRKLFGRRELLHKEKDAITFEEKVFGETDCYLIGYWQSGRYFDQIEDKLRQDFCFDFGRFSNKANSYLTQIKQSPAVSLHVRRGDYLEEKFAPLYGGICTEAYYRSAIDYFRQKNADTVFYLFTDDKEWGRGFAGTEMILVEGTTAEEDMALMSRCKGHILANSSFSFWGAWLDPAPDKEVVMPAKWLNASEGQDIYYGLCSLKIDAEGSIVWERK